MENKDAKRISRVTAILTLLQSKRLVTSTELAKKFGVSVRTIYRDIRSLEEAGIPVVTEEGRGFSIMDTYRMPPLMLTEGEANALILAEQLVLKNPDASFVKEYSEVVYKIKSVLNNSVKDKVNLLAERTRFSQNINNKRSSNSLSVLQFALTNYLLAKIEYSNEAGKISTRIVEPFALLSTQENWLMVAWCRTRKEFRYFRLDRIKKLDVQSEKFTPHKMTLQQFFDKTS